jgi:hypothetical protein
MHRFSELNPHSLSYLHPNVIDQATGEFQNNTEAQAGLVYQMLQDANNITKDKEALSRITGNSHVCGIIKVESFDQKSFLLRQYPGHLILQLSRFLKAKSMLLSGN